MKHLLGAIQTSEKVTVLVVIEASYTTGMRFHHVGEHSAFIKDGGCKLVMNVLAGQTDH